MNKILKILLGLAVGVVVLIGAAAVAVSFIDANRYRPQIVAKVKEATGRELAIGDLHLSLFPVIGLGLKNVQLGNAAGFGDRPQLSVGEAQIGVRLLPLIFHRRVEVGRIRVSDADIDLEVAADGRNNWSDLSQVQASHTKTGAPAEAVPKESSNPTAVVVSGIDIHNATLHYTDRQKGKSYAVDGLDLTTGAIDAGKPFDLSLDFHTQLSDPAMTAAVKASGKVRVDPQPLHYTVNGFKLKVDGSGAGLPGGKLALDLGAAIDGTADAVALNELKLKLDDSTISGKLALTSLKQLAATFALQIDQFDLDRYQAASKKKETGESEPAASKQLSKSSDDTRVPVDALDDVGLDGTLDLGRLKMKGLSTSNVHLVVKSPRGEQKHIQLTANLYSGSLGSDTLITPGREPHYGQSLQLKGVDVGALSRDYLHKDKLEGKGDIDLKFTSAGETVGAIKRALNGNLDFALHDAVVKGFNLAQMVRQGQALLGGQNLQQNSPQQTDFSAITGGGPIVNGVLHGDRLDGRSPLLRLSGQGTIDFVHETIDYVAQPTIVNTTSGQGGKDMANLNGITVPVHVTGSFDEPHYSLDVRSALQQQAVQKLTGKLGDKNQGVSNLLQGLGGLFGGKSQNQQQPPPNNAKPH